MANKAASGGTTVEVPETESTVARTRQSELTIRRDSDILDEVRVTSQTFVGNAGLVFILAKGPDDQRFVTRSGQNHVGGFHSGSNGGNPTAMAF